jgi:hypothetical protein
VPGAPFLVGIGAAIRFLAGLTGVSGSCSRPASPDRLGEPAGPRRLGSLSSRTPPRGSPATCGPVVPDGVLLLTLSPRGGLSARGSGRRSSPRRSSRGFSVRCW